MVRGEPTAALMKNVQRFVELTFADGAEVAKHLTGTHTNSVSQLCEFCILRKPGGGMMTVLRPLGTTDRATKLLMRFNDAGQPVFMPMPQEQRARVANRASR
jgi:hypothetical protein